MVNPLAELTLRGWLMTGRGSHLENSFPVWEEIDFSAQKKRFPTLFYILHFFYSCWLSLRVSLQSFVRQMVLRLLLLYFCRQRQLSEEKTIRVQVLHDLFTFMRNKFRFAQREWNRRWKGQGLFVLQVYEWHSPIGSMPFHRAQNSLYFQGPNPSHLPSYKQLKCSRPGRVW